MALFPMTSFIEIELPFTQLLVNKSLRLAMGRDHRKYAAVPMHDSGNNVRFKRADAR
jgi:hypothetical protein